MNNTLEYLGILIVGLVIASVVISQAIIPLNSEAMGEFLAAVKQITGS